MTVRELIGALAELPKEAFDKPVYVKEFYGLDSEVVLVRVGALDVKGGITGVILDFKE